MACTLFYFTRVIGKVGIFPFDLFLRQICCLKNAINGHSRADQTSNRRRRLLESAISASFRL